MYGIEVERRNFVLGVLARSIGTGETDPNPGKDLIAVIAWGVKSYPAACRQNFQSDINTIVDYAQIFGSVPTRLFMKIPVSRTAAPEKLVQKWRSYMPMPKDGEKVLDPKIRPVLLST